MFRCTLRKTRNRRTKPGKPHKTAGNGLRYGAPLRRVSLRLEDVMPGRMLAS